MITGPDGIEVCLWDLEYLYELLPEILTARQWQAIEWFLVNGYQEDQVAEMMGISPSSPIGKYATAGLDNIIRMIEAGELEKFGPDKPFIKYRQGYICA